MSKGQIVCQCEDIQLLEEAVVYGIVSHFFGDEIVDMPPVSSFFLSIAQKWMEAPFHQDSRSEVTL